MRGAQPLAIALLPPVPARRERWICACNRRVGTDVGRAGVHQEGRRYVQGDQSNKCNFAYLEKPQIQGEAGRLRIRARFTGRTSLNMLGQCVGLGDEFNLVVMASSAVP